MKAAVKSSPYLVLALLVVFQALNYVDRQLPSILAQSIKTELSLSDTQLGSLTGLVFALVYATLGIPLGWFADRRRRVPLVAAACGVWSLFSALSGAATGFVTLALARMGVALGEAGCNPPALSLIADYFPKERRARANGTYFLGIPIGVAIAAAVGGVVAPQYGWRAAFLVGSVPGFFLALLMLWLIAEPVRGTLDEEEVVPDEQAPSFLEVMKDFFLSPKLRNTAIGSGLMAIAAYGLLNWLPTLLIREKGMMLGDIARYYGIVTGLSQAMSLWGGGQMTDRINRLGLRGNSLVPGVGGLLALPLFFLAILQDSWQLTLPLMILPTIFISTYPPASVALVQNSVPANRRALSVALLMLILNLIGLGTGPLLVGIASDLLRESQGNTALGTAMLTVFTPAVLASAAFFFAAARAKH